MDCYMGCYMACYRGCYMDCYMDCYLCNRSIRLNPGCISLPAAGRPGRPLALHAGGMRVSRGKMHG
eukprot:8234872-Pyramimonas_sp.AAC.1